MSSLFVAEFAIFLQLNTVRIVPLIFSCCIISLFAVRASHSYDNPHVMTPPETYSVNAPFLRIKKKRYTGLPAILYHMQKCVSSQNKRDDRRRTWLSGSIKEDLLHHYTPSFYDLNLQAQINKFTVFDIRIK
jgi:hypothetical protein